MAPKPKSPGKPVVITKPMPRPTSTAKPKPKVTAKPRTQARMQPKPKRKSEDSVASYPLVAAKEIGKIAKDTASYYADKLTPKNKNQIVKGGPRPKMKRMAQPALPKRMAQKAPKGR